nr:hypothetical protein [uncultured Niameybacter sp.]
MLSFLFTSQADNEKIWDYIEEYFLGVIPNEVMKQYEKNVEKKKRCEIWNKE